MLAYAIVIGLLAFWLGFTIVFHLKYREKAKAEIAALKKLRTIDNANAASGYAEMQRLRHIAEDNLKDARARLNDQENRIRNLIVRINEAVAERDALRNENKLMTRKEEPKIDPVVATPVKKKVKAKKVKRKR